MRRFLVVLVALAAFAPAARAADQPDCLAPHSWVAGTTSLCHGSIVYGDYVDDDYGADTGQTDTTSRSASLAPSAGDQAYPAGLDATADLVRLTIGVEDGKLAVTGLLNALYHPDDTILAVAIDTDGNQATGGGKWGTLDVSSKGWDEIAYFKTGDPASNTISGTMPLPAGGRWRIQAATAIASSGQVMNVAFRGPEEKASAQGVPQNSDSGSWFEDEQAKALGSGDISQFGFDVARSDVVGGATRDAPVAPGLHERVYRSDYTVPPQNEGVDIAGVPGRGNGGNGVPLGFEQTFQYLGNYQPYGIYIPNKPGPHGMQMVFHGSSSVMSALINQPGMQQRFGEELNRVLVVPEARGQNGWGSDISERDLLDVMSDVEATYPIDHDKVFSGGYSQGGYITYRMAELYPDRFAGAVDWVGFTGNDENGTPAEGDGYTAGAVGNVIDLVRNLRSVPTFMLYAGADELVHVNTANAMDDAFKATDDVFEWYFHPAAEHLTFAALDDWRKEAADTAKLTLIHDPPRVTYRTATVLDDPAMGIVHDHAYWVSQIRSAAKDPTTFEDVDLTTFACGGSVPVTQTGSEQGTDPVPWNADYRKQTGTQALPKRMALEGTISNVASLTVDTGATCLGTGAFTYKITTNGPAKLAFSDGRSLSFPAAGTYSGTTPTPPPAVCTSKRSVRITVRRSRGVHVRSLAIYVNGKHRGTLRTRSRRVRVTLRGMAKGKVTVKVVLRGRRHGHRVTIRDVRRYHTCTPGRRRTA